MRGLIIDTETTGLSHNFNQVLTVGMLLADIDERGVDLIDSDHIKVKHERYNVSGLALKINGIDLKEHDKIGVNPKKACLLINKFVIRNKLKDISAPMIGHNIRFDIRFLRQLYFETKKDYMLDLEIIDTRDLWIDLRNRGIVPGHLKGNLRAVSEHLDVSYDGAHDALNDCMITANVLHKMMVLRNKITV